MHGYTHIRLWMSAKAVLLGVVICTLNISCSSRVPFLEPKDASYNLFAVNNSKVELNNCAIYYDNSKFYKMFGVLGPQIEAGHMNLNYPLPATGQIGFVTPDDKMHYLKIDFATNRPQDFKQRSYEIHVAVNEDNSVEVTYK